MNRTLRAFTLIELLVVIAIIGTIFTIVLAALSVARNKGIDSSVKQNLEGARPQAELFYDVNGSNYVITAGGTTDVCSQTGKVGTTKGIYDFILAAAKVVSIDVVTTNAAADSTHAVCNSSAVSGNVGWAAQVPLITGGFFCVDGKGTATTTSTTGLTSSTDIQC